MKLANRRILVVEDEPIIAWELTVLLASAGAIALGPVQTVKAALHLVEKEPIDCAVLNVELRGERSYPIAEVLTKKQVPFAFVTEYDDSVIPEPFRGRPIVEKPLDESRVIETIAKLCSAE
jgi:DNA-binding NtrC family response regulator